MLITARLTRAFEVDFDARFQTILWNHCATQQCLQMRSSSQVIRWLMPLHWGILRPGGGQGISPVALCPQRTYLTSMRVCHILIISRGLCLSSVRVVKCQMEKLDTVESSQFTTEFGNFLAKYTYKLYGICFEAEALSSPPLSLMIIKGIIFS
jgi:hypothetical protein